MEYSSSCVLYFMLSLEVISVKSYFAQSDSISNSYAVTYQKSNPGLNYSYDPERQIHNYSNNWDFDQDGIKDELYFIGTGGAHLYYYLCVVLSSKQVQQHFKFLITDDPILPPDEILNNISFIPKDYLINFAVFESDGSARKHILINLDQQSFAVNRKILKQLGINTTKILVYFENGKAKFKDLL